MPIKFFETFEMLRLKAVILLEPPLDKYIFPCASYISK